MQTIKLIEVSKSFKSKKALNNVNIEFKSNRINGLLGPNGSGKTTLFNIVAGFLSPDNGQIILDKQKNLGVVFAYPTLDVAKVSKNLTDAKTEDIFEVIYSCVDHIFEGEKIYPAKDTSRDELVEFFESLSQENLVDIRKFFDSMPQLKHEVEVENPKTKVKSMITFRGLSDFFSYASPTIT